MVGPNSLVMSQDQVWFGAVATSSGLVYWGLLALIAPLSDRLIGGQDPIHRPLRAQVMAFVEQRRHDLRRRTVDEARAGEHIEDLLALGFTQRPGGRWTGLPVPGS